jgi:hypothetical protein
MPWKKMLGGYQPHRARARPGARASNRSQRARQSVADAQRRLCGELAREALHQAHRAGLRARVQPMYATAPPRGMRKRRSPSPVESKRAGCTQAARAGAPRTPRPPRASVLRAELVEVGLVGRLVDDVPVLQPTDMHTSGRAPPAHRAPRVRGGVPGSSLPCPRWKANSGAALHRREHAGGRRSTFLAVQLQLRPHAALRQLRRQPLDARALVDPSVGVHEQPRRIFGAPLPRQRLGHERRELLRARHRPIRPTASSGTYEHRGSKSIALCPSCTRRAPTPK